MSKSLSSLLALVLLLMGSQGWAQPPGRGRGHDPEFIHDRDVFHWLLAHHQSMRRQVTEIPEGVQTLTESDDPAVTAKIQEHVAAMSRRMEHGRPIRNRDPLFAALFRHYDQIDIKVENTEQGVRVSETSRDPHIVELIRAHAKVVSGFVKSGFAEARKNHAVPPRRAEQPAPPNRND